MPAKEEHIMMVAEKLFASNGYNGTSIRDIANTAKVNVSMISYYFGSKEKLLEALFKYRMDEGLNFAKKIYDDQSLAEVQKLESIIDNFVNRVQRLKEFFLIVYTQQVVSQNKEIQAILRVSKFNYIKIYKSLIESGIQKGLFTQSPSFHFLQCSISGTIFNALQGREMYKEYLKIYDENFEEQNFEERYFEDLRVYIKTLVKGMIGYKKI